MDLGGALGVAAGWLGMLTLGGLTLSLLVGRLVSSQGRRSQVESDLRRREWEREARLSHLLPGTVPLGQAPRVRPAALDPAFSEPDMLAWAQRAWVELHLALARDEAPALPMSDGAAEALRAGPRLGPIEEALAGNAELRATDRSENWRTVDIALSGLVVERGAEALHPWRFEEVWRLRCAAQAPLPPPGAPGWELLAVLDHRRVRYDLLPCELPDWGSRGGPREPGPRVAELRASLGERLPPERADLESWALRLAREVLTGELDHVVDPLRTVCAAERAGDALCGRSRRLEHLSLGPAVITDLGTHATGLRWVATVRVEGCRVVLDAAGAVIAGDPVQPEHGALELRVREAASGWALWDLRPTRG